MENYTEQNAKTIDRWVEAGWEWGRPISHEVFLRAKENDWDVFLTPVTPVPKTWFPPLSAAFRCMFARFGKWRRPANPHFQCMWSSVYRTGLFRQTT